MALQDLQLSESICGLFICSLVCRPTHLFLSMQILDELIIAGELQESSKKSVLRVASGH